MPGAFVVVFWFISCFFGGEGWGPGGARALLSLFCLSLSLFALFFFRCLGAKKIAKIVVKFCFILIKLDRGCVSNFFCFLLISGRFYDIFAVCFDFLIFLVFFGGVDFLFF